MKLFRGQPNHDYWRSTFTPVQKTYTGCGLSLGFALLGWYEFRNPDFPPFTGRYAFLESFMYSNFGPTGMPILYWIIAAAFAAAAFHGWRKGGIE